MEGTMKSSQKITIVLVAALTFGLSGWAIAEDEPNTKQQNVARQRQGAGPEARLQATENTAGKTHTRQLGPGDGTGNQGQPPANGTGFGSPGRLGSGPNPESEGQGAGQAGKTHTRRLGPGDGTGNQGQPPTNGTGFGSPGRLGSGPEQGAAGKAAGTQAGKGGAKSSGSSTGWRQSRARSITGSGPGGTLCDGTGRTGGARGTGFARRGGGRR
jgi:hypothetical protein